MHKIVQKVKFSSGAINFTKPLLKQFSTTHLLNEKYSCKVLVVGGGTGGCSVAAKFARHLQKHELLVLEPADYHYYQPLFTLIGGGVYSVEKARKCTSEVLPKNAKWLKDRAVKFMPKENLVITEKGNQVSYDFMIVATGLQTNYNQIPGLLEGLQRQNGVCSNYSADYVNLTYKALKEFKEGNAIFTFPASPVKCPGAPQKICYIADHYFQKKGKRSEANITYNTALPVIFGVKQYADALWKVCKTRNINVNLKTNLIEIKPDKKIAVFQNLDSPDKKFETEYSMLHVTPPMSTPKSLSECKDLTNDAGFVEVNSATMQSTRFNNVFSIGDCSSSPNSKTAAAAAAQCPVVYKNLLDVMKGQPLKEQYDGYASCPLVTGYNKCILAEFDYNLLPLETFPFRQDRELISMYLLKKFFMPMLYWQLMVKGYWNGPAALRNILHCKLP